MRSPDYTRLAAQLPAVYQEDAASFAQVDAYLGLADELNHAIVERLEDLPLTFGPDAVLRWPAGLPYDAGADALLAAYLDTYDQVAAWASFTFPASWGRDEAGLTRRREFLARSARLWRRRGTPRGFLSWFTLYFGVSTPGLPYLLEHYKAPGAGITARPYTATLFVPGSTDFASWGRREEAVDFVNRYAPAHVDIRVCFIDPDLFASVVFATPPTLPDNPTGPQVTAYAAAVAGFQRELNGLLCSVKSTVSHANGIHIYECIDEGRPIDRLDVGLLPTDTPGE
ncbi:hypothetical protein [Actinoplanes flavus]|uniref:Uncharacterized protein n=1 Tax=Actinoplanes flavus TaxID=2820290 RepID=A0ABS3UTA8_9ACTN|nr:hypothetical protein [Actinoplanes flavus]MBO3741806.1 hypothetical protein [Actinoplanes flavus]